jgi:hypothetical protein
MASKPQQLKGRDGLLSTLEILIQALSFAKDACGIPPAQIAIGSANALLTMIRVRSCKSRNDPPVHIRPGLCR